MALVNFKGNSSCSLQMCMRCWLVPVLVLIVFAAFAAQIVRLQYHVDTLTAHTLHNITHIAVPAINSSEILVKRAHSISPTDPWHEFTALRHAINATLANVVSNLASISPRAGPIKSKEAWVWFMSEDQSLPLVLALEQSMRHFASPRPRVIVITANISASARKVLTNLNLIVVPSGDLAHVKLRRASMHWHRELNKSVLFGLDVFDKLVYLDLNFVLMRSLDHLFDMGALAQGAVYAMTDIRDCGTIQSHSSTGLLVFKPNASTYIDWMTTHVPYKHADLTVQHDDPDVMNSYLQRFKHVRLLGETDAAFLTRCECARRGLLTNYNSDTVRAIHFGDQYLRSADLIAHGLEARPWNETCGIPYYQQWLQYYTDMHTWYTRAYGTLPVAS